MLSANNPGNIRVAKAKWQGQTGEEKGFVTFSSMAYGYRAMIILLQNYGKLYGCTTIAQIVDKWAPPQENNTIGYIRAVENMTGFGANERIDLNDKQVICKLTAAMSRQENGITADINAVHKGWQLAQSETV